MRKQIIGIALLALLGTNVAAQDSLRINKYDGSGTHFALKDIQSLRLADQTDTTTASKLLPAVLGQVQNLRLFSRMLQETGWDKKLTAYCDMDYVQLSENFPARRLLGYTVFAETDETLAQHWNIRVQTDEQLNITNWAECAEALEAKCRQVYPTAEAKDWTDADNAVNRFVAYHLIKGRYTKDQLVAHGNETGYTPATGTLGVSVSTYHETMGNNRALLKFTEGNSTDGLRINRCCSKRDPRTYEELTVERPGISISAPDDNAPKAENGNYYLLGEPLCYTPEVCEQALDGCLRFDVASLLPELASNGMIDNNEAKSYDIPAGFFENLTWNHETSLCYRIGPAQQNPAAYNDEFNFRGRYEFCLRLPPVPRVGTYQLRIGMVNYNLRGMYQCYVGAKPTPTEASIPLTDGRLNIVTDADTWNTEAGSEAALRTDAFLRQKGYMKAPRLYTVGNRTLADNPQALRQIVATMYMQPSQTYYLRIKNVLESTNLTGFLDYIELVPKHFAEENPEMDAW